MKDVYEQKTQTDVGNGYILYNGSANKSDNGYIRSYKGISLKKGETISVMQLQGATGSVATISVNVDPEASYTGFEVKVRSNGQDELVSYTAEDDCFAYICLVKNEQNTISYTISRQSDIGLLKNRVDILENNLEEDETHISKIESKVVGISEEGNVAVSQGVILSTNGSANLGNASYRYNRGKGIELKKGLTIVFDTVNNDSYTTASIISISDSPDAQYAFTPKVAANGGHIYEYTAETDCYVYLSKNTQSNEDFIYTIKRYSELDNIEKKVDDLGVTVTEISEKVGMFSAPVRMYPNAKLPAIAFIFDDCTNFGADKITADLFKSYGLTCGFAFMASEDNLSAHGELYKGLQYEGHSILSHSIDAATVTDSTALNNIATSLDRLTKAGFVVNGWVSPNSVFPVDSKYILRKFHAYAFINGSKYDRNDNPCEIIRHSIQSTPINDIKSNVDDAIANDKILVFYGHTYNYGTSYSGEVWNLDKVRTVIEYCLSKRNAGLVYMGNPDDAMKYYYDL